MSGIYSQSSYDLGLVKVPVIASFDTEGRVRPLYIRSGEESLKIHSVVEKPSTFDFKEFQCQVIDGDRLKPLMLTYRMRDTVWTIAKRRSV